MGYHGKQQFSRDYMVALKISQNIAKSMAYMINQLDGIFQQGSPCTKPTSSI